VQDLDPRLLEAARRARKKYRHIFASRIPLVKTVKRKLRDAEGRPTKKHVELHQVDVLFRALTAFEFDAFANDSEHGDITEAVIREAVLWPQTNKNWMKHPLQMASPGHFEGLRDRIIEVSGFGDVKAFEGGLEMGRQEAGSLYAVAEAFICKAFPRYDPFMLQQLPWLDQVRLLGAAEVVLGQEFPLKDILNPKKEPTERKTRIPDASELPSQRDVEMMGDTSEGGRAAAIQKMRQEAAAWAQIPEEERRAIANERRAGKAAIREAESQGSMAASRARRGG